MYAQTSFQIAKEGIESLDVKSILLDLRRYRKGLIQTPDQLKFSCLSIAEGARQEGLLSESMRNGQNSHYFTGEKSLLLFFFLL